MRKSRVVAVGVALVAVAALAGCIGADPLGTASDEAGGDADGTAQGEAPSYGPGRHDDSRWSGDEIRPQPPGTEEHLTLDHGPFLVGPGQDHSRLRLQLPVDAGFVTEFEARLVNPATGDEPGHDELHLHHGVGLRAEDDPTEPEGMWPFVDWFWATGHERTRANLTAVADADPDGPRYGVFLEAGDPHVLDFMVSNLEAKPKPVLVRLEVTFVHGNADEIEAADDCAGAPEDARCRAGETFHELERQLWGGFPFDVPREPRGDGTYVWPPERSLGDAWTDPITGDVAGAPWDGVAVLGGGHLHQNGKEVVVANLGPPGSGCDEDVDGDGWPGVTIYRSRTRDRPAKAWPHSDTYQVTATQAGWRAPVHEGDRITLWGTYANRDQAEEDAMAIAGLYVDADVEPEPADHADGCDADALAPTVVGDERPAPGYTIETRPGGHAHADVCDREGLGADLPAEEPCDRPVDAVPERVPTRTVHIESFTYTPGDLKGPSPADRVPVVEQGETLVWVNHDAAKGIRHTVTACPWPCNGPGTANYPQSSGAFDSGKLGNADPGDDGANGPEDLPTWRLDTSDLEPGLYAYHDRLHPWMRGWFEVVEGDRLPDLTTR